MANKVAKPDGAVLLRQRLLRQVYGANCDVTLLTNHTCSHHFEFRPPVNFHKPRPTTSPAVSLEMPKLTYVRYTHGGAMDRNPYSRDENYFRYRKL